MKTKFQVKQLFHKRPCLTNVHSPIISSARNGPERTGTAFRFVKWIGVTDPFRRGMLERTRTPSGSSFFNNYYFFHYEICCRLDKRTTKRYPQNIPHPLCIRGGEIRRGKVEEGERESS